MGRYEGLKWAGGWKITTSCGRLVVKSGLSEMNASRLRVLLCRTKLGSSLHVLLSQGSRLTNLFGPATSTESVAGIHAPWRSYPRPQISIDFTISYIIIWSRTLWIFFPEIFEHLDSIKLIGILRYLTPLCNFIGRFLCRRPNPSKLH